MANVIEELEKKLKDATTSGAMLARDFKKASTAWEIERKRLQDAVNLAETQLARKEEERWKVLEQFHFHRDLNRRYIELARFILFCSLHISIEDDLLDLQPEEFLVSFRDFIGPKDFDIFIAKAAVILGFPES